MILDLFLLFIAFSFSRLLDTIPPKSNEVNPPANQTQDFIPGKIVFSITQKIIIFTTVIICAILIIIGAVVACQLRRKTKKNPDTAEIERYMLPPSGSPFASLDDAEI